MARHVANAVRDLKGDEVAVTIERIRDLFNAELAGVWGPLRVQAEWTGNRLSNAALPGNPVLGTAWFQGYYVEAMYLSLIHI